MGEDDPALEVNIAHSEGESVLDSLVRLITRSGLSALIGVFHL